jgi:hypothetical protein
MRLRRQTERERDKQGDALKRRDKDTVTERQRDRKSDRKKR